MITFAISLKGLFQRICDIDGLPCPDRIFVASADEECADSGNNAADDQMQAVIISIPLVLRCIVVVHYVGSAKADEIDGRGGVVGIGVEIMETGVFIRMLGNRIWYILIPNELKFAAGIGLASADVVPPVFF